MVSTACPAARHVAAGNRLIALWDTIIGKKVVMVGCGACVAACPNASAMLFTSAKITHLNSLPQGHRSATREP